MMISEIDKFYGQEKFFNRKRSVHCFRGEKIKSILKESYGSFPEQYDGSEKIAGDIIVRIEKKQYEIKENYYTLKVNGNINGIGNISVIVKWYNDKYGDKVVYGKRTDKNVVELTVHAANVIYYNLVSTIAHEIMHCFQDNLSKIKGVNAQSAFLYSHILEFYHNSPSEIVANFFYGLYICYSIEASANISSTANYISGIFKGKQDVTTKEIELALKKFDKYQDYKEIYNYFINKTFNSFSEDDINYVIGCLTGFQHNYNNDKLEVIYKKNIFNAETFINKNIKKIVDVCEKTLKKMDKNVMLYFHKEKR